jgi:hypothetical protein
MAWVVDTCLLIDIGSDDPVFFTNTRDLLRRKFPEGLVVCPVTFVEIAPAFGGSPAAIEEFLTGLGINYHEEWTWDDTRTAGVDWTAHVQKRRAKLMAKRLVADALIGAFASRFDGLLTRNRADFAALHPGLRIVEP